MELSISNLYAYNAKILVFEDDSIELTREVLPYVLSPYDQKHTIQIGDELDLIAYEYYKDYIANPEHYWFYIADVNADIISNPLFLEDLVGQEIIIPDILRLA